MRKERIERYIFSSDDLKNMVRTEVEKHTDQTFSLDEIKLSLNTNHEIVATIDTTLFTGK